MPFAVGAFDGGGPGSRALVLGAFCFAAASDAVDGPLARRGRGASLSWGRADVAADVVWNAACFLVGFLRGIASPAPFVAVVVLGVRYLWRERRARSGDRLPSDRAGKAMGVAFYVVSAAITLSLAAGFPPAAAVHAVGDVVALAAAMLLASQLVRVNRARRP